MILNLSRYFNIKNSLTQFFLFLAGFAALATFDTAGTSPTALLNIVVLGVTAYIGVAWLHKIELTTFNPLNIFVTALILYVLIHPSNSLLMFILPVLIVVCEKYIRKKGQPIFNPAALSLFVTYYLSVFLQSVGILDNTLLVSWWGADLNQSFLIGVPLLSFLVPAALLLGFGYFAFKYKKGMLIGMFFMTSMFFVFYTNLSSANSSVETIRFLIASLFNSFAFMTLVMIPEPKTSPAFMKQQAIIGVLGGIVFYIFSFVTDSLFGFLVGLPFITTILLMNLATFGLKKARLFQK